MQLEEARGRKGAPEDTWLVCFGRPQGPECSCSDVENCAFSAGNGTGSSQAKLLLAQ